MRVGTCGGSGRFRQKKQIITTCWHFVCSMCFAPLGSVVGLSASMGFVAFWQWFCVVIVCDVARCLMEFLIFVVVVKVVIFFHIFLCNGEARFLLLWLFQIRCCKFCRFASMVFCLVVLCLLVSCRSNVRDISRQGELCYRFVRTRCVCVCFAFGSVLCFLFRCFLCFYFHRICFHNS